MRGLRRHLGLTQAKLARELGTRQQTISEWETGLYRPRGASATLLSLVAEHAGFKYEATITESVPDDREAIIRLYLGDIVDLEVEAIVNAANNHLWMGGGVAGAIKRKGGEEIEAEAMREGPIPIGEAIITGAGRLQARYVIHAAVMGQDLATDADKIRKATASALGRAAELGVRSLALPALGTGVGGFPVKECARIMLEEVKGFLAGPASVEEVVFALRGEGAYLAFQEALGNTGDASMGDR
ncbi:MAG: macro domain-containing protein [Chloroflexi bacterium]|nr:macro domain-containing protein [Chloroflexota bacterium]